MHYSASPRINVLIAILLAMSSAGCQQGDSTPAGASTFPDPPSEFDEALIEPDGALSVDGLTVKNLSQWTLPIDPYLHLDHMTHQAAKDRFLYSCLQRHHVYLANKPLPYNQPPAHHPDLSASGITYVFTPEFARKYGYNVPSDPKSTALASSPFDDEIMAIYAIAEEVTTISQYEDQRDEGITAQSYGETVTINSEKATHPSYQALTACNNELEQPENRYLAGLNGEELTGEKNPTISDFYNADPRHTLHTLTGERTPLLQRKRQEWKACMQPLGIADLPDDPSLMPPLSAKASFPETDESSPSPQEIALAVKDAECRQSSGFLRTSYDIQWALMQAYVQANQQRLKHNSDVLTEYRNKQLEYISENQ